MIPPPHKPERVDAPPAPIVITRESRDARSSLIGGLTLVLLLAVLGAVLLVLFTVASLVNVPGQVAGGLGSRLGAVAETSGQAVARAQQAIEDATDPAHPPVGLTYDTEFSSLLVIHTAEHLPGGTDYALSLTGLTRRPNPASADVAQYATIHAELRQPHETRLLGQLLRSDSDAHDYAVYKGESFRVGRSVFRVNWVSASEASVAIAAYRAPDTISAPLKFDYP
ncbi:MAG: hypothetical protein NVSMB2_07190 [Chloroflexota bacterium]